MVALDLLGRRGALRILWELRGEPLTFRALQDAAQAQPGLLNTRLAELRDAGLRVEYALAPQAVGKQLKLADSRGARVAIVIGPDDRARGEVMLKDLRANTQSGTPRERVVDQVAALIRGANG